MLLCALCHQKLPDTSKFRAANDNAGIIYVKNNHKLLHPENIQKVAGDMARLPVTSRDIVDWITDALFIKFDGVYLWPSGDVFEIDDGEIDRVFDNETVARWIRSLRQRADEPFTQVAPLSLAKRYRLLDAALQAEHRFNLTLKT